MPSILATCDIDGMPNVSLISQVHYVDPGRVALSYQFFNKTRRNLLATRTASVAVVDPVTCAQYHLELDYEETQTQGPLFEAMKAKLAGFASHSGMEGVFRLLGVDVFRVRSIGAIDGPTLGALPGRQHLPAVRRTHARLSAAPDLETLLDSALEAMRGEFCIEHALVLMLDAQSGRLYTVASRGYPASGIGSKVALGEGVIGVAAREGVPIRIGHMTSAVGVIWALGADDQILTNHRSAGHLLARGADPDKLLAEIMGRQDGYCGGKSGPLYVSARASSAWCRPRPSSAANSPWRPALPSAAGWPAAPGSSPASSATALPARADSTSRLNLAAIWGLPVLYVCENNHWQAFVHRDVTMLVTRIAERAAGYGIEGAAVDGTDVVAVHEAARRAIARIGETGRPFLLETVSYRLRGHFEPGDMAYVDGAELASWQARDPVPVLRERLREAGSLSAADLAAMEARVARRIAASQAFAAASPFPAPEALTTEVYA